MYLKTQKNPLLNQTNAYLCLWITLTLIEPAASISFSILASEASTLSVITHLVFSRCLC